MMKVSVTWCSERCRILEAIERLLHLRMRSCDLSNGLLLLLLLPTGLLSNVVDLTLCNYLDMWGMTASNRQRIVVMGSVEDSFCWCDWVGIRICNLLLRSLEVSKRHGDFSFVVERKMLVSEDVGEGNEKWRKKTS